MSEELRLQFSDPRYNHENWCGYNPDEINAACPICGGIKNAPAEKPNDQAEARRPATSANQ